MEAAPTLLSTTAEELTKFGWDADAQCHPEDFARPLLACGHYDKPTFIHSSQWDFPHDAHICPTCGEERQWDLRLQLEVMESW